MYKSIKDYEGFYEVNELGKVRSVDRKVEFKDGSTRKYKGKELKPSMDQGGYAFVILNKNGIAKTYKVHRLVAETLLPNAYNLPEVHHLNHETTDNRVENLKWVSRAEQIDNHWRAAQGTKLRVVGHGIDKKFISAMAVQRELGITAANAINVAKGKFKQSKGYKIYFC